MSAYYSHTDASPYAPSAGLSRNVHTEFDKVEDGFDSVETAMGLKAPLASPSLTGNVGIDSAGTTSSPAMFRIPQFTLEVAAGYGGLAAYCYSTTAGQASMLVLGKSNNATKNVLTATASGNAFGYIAVEGVNSSSALTTAGYMAFNQDGAAGASTIPCRFSLWLATASGGAAERLRVDSAGTLTVYAGSILIAGAGGLGYATGSGGAVTQITSRATGVNLHKTNGGITLFSALGMIGYTSFTVTNSTVAATDTVVLSVKSGTNTYLANVTAVAAGSFQITFNTTGGIALDAPVFNFAVIKATTA